MPSNLNLMAPASDDLHLPCNPVPTEAQDRAHSRCWGIQGSERAAMGVASYYHPEGTLEQPGTDPLDAPQ